MSVTTHILRLLDDGGCGMEDAITVARAMERGEDASKVFYIVETLEARGGTPEALAKVIVYYAAALLAEGGRSASRRASTPANFNAPAGPKDRWGYDGPITPRLHDRDWWPLRNGILERDNHECHYCGQTAKCADHVVPLSRGGSNEADNLVACCLPCNSSKSDRLLEEWNGRQTA